MHIYFSGIGGKGVAALAHLALDAGYRVSGSDKQASSTTRELNKRGVSVAFSQDGKFLDQTHARETIDWFVYTAALSADHPELVLAKDKHIKTSKRDEFINWFTKTNHLKLLAISGSHGKSTTTSMLIWLFKQSQVPLSYAVGADISFGRAGEFQQDSQWFVFEADEFDRNMLKFMPDESVIVNIDYDHKDTYPTRQDYQQAFELFIGQSSHAILWQNDAQKISVDTAIHTVIPETIDVSQLELIGQHNRRNGWLAATGYLYATNYKNRNDTGVWQGILKHLHSFPGTRRRLEKIAANIYSDFAHTPEEIIATLQAVSEVHENVVVVYQPHQNSRQHELLGAYEDCFDQAEKVLWLPTYLSREDPEQPVLKPEELIPTNNREKFTVAELNNDLAATIENLTQSHTVICMGAGNIDDWLRQNFKNS